MKKIILILLLAMPIAINAQTETSKDTTRILNKESLKFDERLDHYLKQDYSLDSEKNTSNPAYTPLKVENEKPVDLKLPPLNIYTGPPLENNTFTRFPFTNDYSFYSGMILSDRAWLTSSSSQFGYPTIGTVRSASLNFNYAPTDWLSVGAGPYGSKYNLYGRNFNDVGVNGAVKLRITDRLSVNGFGQYSVYADQNKVYGPLINMYPSTYYGGGLEFKITEKFGVQGGFVRELNPFTGKWQNVPYIAPVFYSK